MYNRAVWDEAISMQRRGAITREPYGEGRKGKIFSAVKSPRTGIKSAGGQPRVGISPMPYRFEGAYRKKTLFLSTSSKKPNNNHFLLPRKVLVGLRKGLF